MKLRFFNYRFADQILNSDLKVKNGILNTLKNLEFAEWGISRPDMNEIIDKKLVAAGWQRQFPIFGNTGYKDTRLDFMKARIGVEVQFGHASFIGIDLLKFQIASYAGLDKIDTAVYVVATKDFIKNMKNRGQKWEGSLTFEKVEKYLPHFKSAIHVPILVIGLDP